MYAIIKTGGKQLKVEAGQTIYVEKLDAKEGDKVTFDKVVFVVAIRQLSVLLLLKVLQLKLQLKNKGVLRKLLLSSTSLRSINIQSKVIVNHTQRLLLTLSMLNLSKRLVLE